MKFLCYRSLRHLVQAGTRCLLAFLLLGASGLIAAQEVPQLIGYCKNCSEWAFGYTAESVAPLIPGTYPVYVLDTATGEVRYFDVHVWFDSGGGTHPQAGGGASTQHHGLHKEAIPGAGDPEIILAMEGAFVIAADFAESLPASMPIGDLGIDISSAIDLVGPDDSTASYNRGLLEAALNQHFQGHWHSTIMGLGDLLARLANSVLGSGLITGPFVVKIEFPDGTSVDVELESISLYLTHIGLSFRFKVLPETVEVPNLPNVPQSAGQFSEFSYSGSGEIVNSLVGLGERFGLSFGPPGGGGGAVCESGCPSDGNCYVSCPKLQ